jgi:deoxyribonuclease-4
VRIGCHTSISGSLEKAALRAAAIGANTFQIFSTSPRMWRASVHGAHEVKLLQDARAKHDLKPLVIHSNYLINLASCSEDLRLKSVESFRNEIQRGLTIGAEYLVVHPGNCKGHTPEQGVIAVVRSLAEAAAGLDTRSLMILLENTAGSGEALGSRLEELALMRYCAHQVTALRVGFCIDTCHCHSSGYDVASAAGLRKTVAEIDRVLGLENVKVIHANDSKTPFNSRVDRHENIGEGTIGEEGFRRILTHPKLRSKPFILETPYEDEDDDRRNIDTLKRLATRSPMRPQRPMRRRGGTSV